MKPGANESPRPPLYNAPGFIAQIQKLRSALQKYDFVEVKNDDFVQKGHEISSEFKPLPSLNA